MARLDPDILRVLPTSHSPVKWITTPQVAEFLRRLNIPVKHVKTVQRRLQALEVQNVVISRRAGTALEWQKKEGTSGIAARAGSLMTFDEALALQVLHRFAFKQIPTLVGASLRGLFEASESRLKNATTADGQRHAKWDRKIAVVHGGFELLRPKVREEIFQAISHALFTEQLLEVAYRKQPPANPAHHTVMPLGLVETTDLIYLVAQVPDKPAAVMYRLDRMESAKVRDEGFTYPRNFSLRSYVETEKKFDFFPQGEIQLVLRFAEGVARSVEEAPLSKDQKVEQHNDGTATVRATVMMSERLRWWLRAYGPYVEVIAPKQLRRDFAVEAKDAYALYVKSRS